MTIRNYCRLALAAFIGCLSAASIADTASAFRKLGAIEAGTVPRNSSVKFTRAELDGWIIDEARAHVPQGIRSVRLELSPGRVVGYASIDFLKVRQATTTGDPGWLIKNIFAGERPVIVTVRFQSANGRARADVERVEISGVPLEGRALDFVIENYVRPTFPDVKVNEWFPLHFGVDRFTINPQGVVVNIGSKH